MLILMFGCGSQTVIYITAQRWCLSNVKRWDVGLYTCNLTSNNRGQSVS